MATDLCSFSPTIKYYLPEKYFNILEKGWTSSIASYTGSSSVDKFLDDIKEYARFPGSHIYFGMALTDPLPTMFDMHHDLENNEQYIYKQDILNIVQRTVYNLEYDHDSELHECQKLFINSVIGFYLKSFGLLFLQGNLELVPYPENILTKFSELLEEKMKNVKPVHKLTDETSCNETIEKLEKILLLNKKSPKSESLLKMVEKCGVPPSNLEFFERCINRISVIVGEINGFMPDMLELVLAGKVGTDFIPTVRVFDDGNNEKFVLVHELWREMTSAKLDTSRIEVEVNMPELWTEDFQSIQCLLGDDFDEITFVICEIPESSRLAGIIPSINGKFCFMTSHFLLEIIGEMITTHGYFQNLNSAHWNMLTPLFDELANRVKRESNDCRLIETKAAIQIKKWMLEETGKVFACCPKKTKEIRTIRKDWFTVKNVKNELKRLGIAESFAPQMESVSINNAYNAITKKRDVRVMPAKYFHETLEAIQLALLMNKIEKIWHNLHTCGDCNFIFSKCIFCNGYVLPSENQSLWKKKEKKKRQAEKKRLAKGGQKAVEEVAPKNDSSDTQAEQVALEAPPGAPASTLVSVAPEPDPKADASTQHPIPDPLTSQEPVPENVEQTITEPPKHVLNSCAKCYRTSQHCEKAKNALREEKTKTKTLNKKVIELSEKVVEKDEQLKRKYETISEKDEEIRLLKEKLAAMEASLQQSATKFSDQPSASDQSREEEEDEQPVRYLTPTNKNSEFSVETRAKFNKLLNIRDSHGVLERQARQRVRALSNKSEDFGIRRMAHRELVQLLKSYEAYFQVVEDNIKWIQKHKNNHLDKLTTLPELPKFSDTFETVYDEVVNEELSDKQCPVCLEEIEDLSGSIKCKCKKRYHTHCAWDMDANGFKCYCEERLPLD